MKTTKKVLALIISLVMVLGITAGVFAAPVPNTHTIKIENDDQNVDHVYNVYQVFSGNLNAEENTLSDIQWGSSITTADQAALLTELKAADLKGDDPLTTTEETTAQIFSSCSTAQDVAKVLATLSSTATFTASTRTLDGTSENAGALDTVANIIAKYVTTVAAADASGTASKFTKNGTIYTATVYGDGYYIVIDETTNLISSDSSASDTLAKYMLTLIRDETIVAKDTGLIPDKKILGGSTHLAADSAAIGDEETFVVTVDVPNTVKFESFYFCMNDTLPEGITFTGITSVKIDSEELSDYAKASNPPTAADYDGTDGYYELAVKNSDDSTNDYEWEATDFDPVAAAGGQKISLNFFEFKKFVEENSLIGKEVTITYKGVVNDDAEYKATENKNEVTFTYSNNPNDSSVHGTTPGSTTRTYTTSLKLFKVDEKNQKLAGATFELNGDALNRTVITGYKFVTADYQATGDEVVDTTTKYWKLLDGSYTKTDPATVANNTQYADTTTVYYVAAYTFDEVSTKMTDLVLVSDENGIIEFVGLNEGTYTLEEIAAPDGFNKIDGTASITINWTDPEAATKPSGYSDADWAAAKAQGGFTFVVSTDSPDWAKAIAWNATDLQFEVTIQNMSGSRLPATGGIGTTIFYAVGGLMVLGAAVVLITKRRMSAEK